MNLAAGRSRRATRWGRGRPKGSRNKKNADGQDLLDRYALPLVGKCIESALKNNDRSAMRLCMDRILPGRREAPVRLSLPRVQTAQDLEKAAEKVTQAIAHGRITPAEGEKMMNVLEIQSRIIQNSQYESRLEKLEESMAASRPPKAA
jgi:predicted DNA-binding protein (UPF0251 family)